jgi:osomolarity two-component system sensor histidine kinase SLN1
MDQGGLLAFVDPMTGSATSIPTRSIGDVSTGTAVQPSSPGEAPRRKMSGMFKLEDSSTRSPGPGAIELPPRAFVNAATENGSPGRVSSPLNPNATPKPERRTSTGAAAARAPTPTSPAMRMPVLVVDDDHLTRMLMKRMLTRLGCDVTTAENGALALAALGAEGTQTPASEPGHAATLVRSKAEHGQAADWYTDDSKFAVVFLDNQMPVLSGLQAVARLRGAGRRDFVVGVTGNALLSDQEEYIDAGVDQ